MKFKLITIAVMATMALAACGSNPNQKSNAEVALQMTQSNNQVTLKQVELMIEREKTRQAELAGQTAFATALKEVGSSTGATELTKVTATVALLGATRGSGTGNSTPATNEVPRAMPNVTPPPERDGLDRFVQVASVLVPGGIPALASPVLGFLSNKEHEVTNRISAEFSYKGQAAQWQGLSNIVSSSNSTIQSVVGSLGQPSYTWNVGGDYAGANLVGRYSGVGSGGFGAQNFGSGILNQGANSRFNSPGPYTQPQCTITPTTTNSSTTGNTPSVTSGTITVSCPATE